MIKLSIIIPLYNVEKYIEKCIVSIAEQDIDPIDYEIIIVNDGSTDSSLKVVKNVSKNYHNIIIINQKNMGAGGARNTGVKAASGTYIWFIDADDFIAEKSISSMLTKAFDFDTDVLAFDFCRTNTKGELIDNWINFKFKFTKTILTGDEFYSLNYEHNYIVLYFFKRELFINHDLSFKNNIYMQDSEFLPRLLHKVNSVVFYDKVIYYYVNRDDSSMNNKINTVRLAYYQSIIKVSVYLNVFQKTISNNSLMYNALTKKQQRINRLLFRLFIVNDFDKKTLNKLIKQLKENKLYPFKWVVDKSTSKILLYNFFRPFININPLLSRKIFLSLKR